MQFILKTLLILFLLSGRVFAGPSGQVWVDEDILGLNDSHLFIMRNVHDNLAFHDVLRTDTFLISKNIETGFDDEIWPVRSVVYYDRSYENHHKRIGNEGRLTETEPTGRVDPYKILIENFARPNTSNLRAWSWGSGRIAKLENDFLTFEMTEAGVQHRIGFDALHAQIAFNMTGTYSFMEAQDPSPRDTLPLTGMDILEDMQIDILQDCKVIDGFKERSSGRKWMFAKLLCEHEEAFSISTWIVVPPQN